MRIILASDLCRLILLNRPEALLQQLQQWSAAGTEIIISSITYAELIAGAMLTTDKAEHMLLVKEFCERLDEIVAWDSGAVDAYSSLQLQAMEQGQSLNMNDAMLAAHAISLDATLLSTSGHAFSNMQGIQLQLWSDPVNRP